MQILLGWFLQTPSAFPSQSRLFRRQTTSYSPTLGSTDPSPGPRRHIWFRAQDQRDMECFSSDRVRHAEATMSSHLTTREKQRYVWRCLVYWRACFHIWMLFTESIYFCEFTSGCPTGWTLFSDIGMKSKNQLWLICLSAAPAALSNRMGSVPRAAPALPLRHGHAQSLPPLPHPAGVWSRWRRYAFQLCSGELQLSITRWDATIQHP